MIIRDLITRLGFQVDDKGMQAFNKTMQTAKRTALLVGGGLIAMGVTFLKAAGDMEQTEIAFETMTGSAEKAQKLIEDLTAFAAKTPFEMKGLIENSKKMLAFGFASDEIVAKLTFMGNIAAGVGRDKLPTLVAAFGKIKVKGKASMEELNMMLEAGVPILDQLAKNAGISTDNMEPLFKLISTGKIRFKDVNKALEDLGNGLGPGGFGGLMVKQSKSFLGMISNVGDFLEVFAVGVGKELLPAAKEFVGVLIEWMEANRGMIKQNIVSFFKDLFSVVRLLIKFFKAAINFTGGFKNLVKLVALVGLSFKLAALNAGAFSVAAMLIPLAITAVIALIALMAEDLYQFFTGGESWTKDFVDMFKLAWQSLVDFAGAVWNDMINGITESINNVVNSVKGLFGKAVKITGAGEGFKSAQGFIQNQNPLNAPATVNPGSITRPGATNNNSNKTVVNSNVTMAVAPGTPTEQKKQIGDFAKKAFGDVFRQQFNILDLNNPVVEK